MENTNMAHVLSVWMASAGTKAQIEDQRFR